METEHYIDGQHNGGVYNSFNNNPYIYCYQSPVMLIDPNGKQVWSRIWGGVKAVGGGLEMVAGGALLAIPEPTMATKVAGVVVVAHGADVASAGLKQIWTGEDTSSLTSQGLQAVGMSKQNAEMVDASISIIGTAGAGTISNASKAGLVTTETVEASKSIISTENGIEITGFTRHGLNRAIERGVKTDGILDAVKNPLKTGKVVTDKLGRQSQRFIGKQSEVVVNPENGKIISVNPTSSKKAANLLKNVNNK